MSFEELENIDIDNDLKTILINYVASYNTCKNNIEYIENLEKEKMIICETPKKTIHKKSIFISRCKNCIFTLNNKINHITLEKCNNIILIVNDGLISGIDILHSHNVTCLVPKPIYFFGCGTSSNITLILKKENMLIDYTNCYKMNIRLLDKKIKTYKMHYSLFSGRITFNINDLK